MEPGDDFADWTSMIWNFKCKSMVIMPFVVTRTFSVMWFLGNAQTNIQKSKA